MLTTRRRDGRENIHLCGVMNCMAASLGKRTVMGKVWKK